MERRDAVKALIIKENKALFLWDPNFSEEVKWDLPGGGKHPGESDETALKRETMEEAGIDIKVLRLINRWEHPVARRNFLLIGKTYLCEPISTDVKIGRDPDLQHTAFKWIPVEEAKKMKFANWLVETFKCI